MSCWGETELDEIARGVAAALEGEGVVLAVEGSAGIGKTALVRAALRVAGANGMRTLLATAMPLETAFSFGVARQLRSCSAPPGCGSRLPGQGRTCGCGGRPVGPATGSSSVKSNQRQG